MAGPLRLFPHQEPFQPLTLACMWPAAQSSHVHGMLADELDDPEVVRVAFTGLGRRGQVDGGAVVIWVGPSGCHPEQRARHGMAPGRMLDYPFKHLKAGSSPVNQAGAGYARLAAAFHSGLESQPQLSKPDATGQALRLAQTSVMFCMSLDPRLVVHVFWSEPVHRRPLAQAPRAFCQTR